MLKSKSKLDNDSKLVYDNILSAWETYNPNPSFQINKNVNMQKIFEYIKYDNPGLFFIDFKNIAVSGSGSSVKVQTNFLYNKKQINNMEKQIEAIIVSILSSDKFKSSDNYNKEIILHDYLTENIVYTMNNSTNETTSIAGAFITKKAVCEGFAKAFKLLCDNAGLSCIFVSGKAVSPQLNYYLKNKLCAASREEFIKFIKEQGKQLFNNIPVCAVFSHFIKLVIIKINVKYPIFYNVDKTGIVITEFYPLCSIGFYFI